MTAVNERPEELMAKHFAKVDQPTLREPDDIRRYIHDLERLGCTARVCWPCINGSHHTAVRYVS